MELYVKMSFISIFSFFLGFRIFNTDLSYPCANFLVQIGEKSSYSGGFYSFNTI